MTSWVHFENLSAITNVDNNLTLENENQRGIQQPSKEMLHFKSYI